MKQAKDQRKEGDIFFLILEMIQHLKLGNNDYSMYILVSILRAAISLSYESLK